MNIFNYFKFVATGYVRKKKKLYGKNVYFTYRHDTEIFDPFKMVLDHFYKIDQTPASSHFDVNTDFSLVKSILRNADNKKPKVVIKLSLDIGMLEFRRLVLKEEKRTTSLYIVYLEGKPVFFLNKKYDYGNNLHSLVTEQVLHGVNIEQWPDKQSAYSGCLFFNKSQEACFVEKFVHSHIFFIADTKLFKKISNEMNACLQKSEG